MIKSILKDTYNIEISRNTLKSICKEKEIKSYIRKKKPLLTQK